MPEKESNNMDFENFQKKYDEMTPMIEEFINKLKNWNSNPVFVEIAILRLFLACLQTNKHYGDDKYNAFIELTNKTFSTTGLTLTLVNMGGAADGNQQNTIQ